MFISRQLLAEEWVLLHPKSIIQSLNRSNLWSSKNIDRKSGLQTVLSLGSFWTSIIICDLFFSLCLSTGNKFAGTVHLYMDNDIHLAKPTPICQMNKASRIPTVWDLFIASFSKPYSQTINIIEYQMSKAMYFVDGKTGVAVQQPEGKGYFNSIPFVQAVWAPNDAIVIDQKTDSAITGNKGWRRSATINKVDHLLKGNWSICPRVRTPANGVLIHQLGKNNRK